MIFRHLLKKSHWAWSEKEINALGYEPFIQPKDEIGSFVFHENHLSKIPIDNKSLDAVLFNHSLAHVFDLAEVSNWVCAKLKKRGWIIIRTPNPSSFQNKIFRSRWQGRDVERMLYWFSPLSLQNHWKKYNCSIKKIDYTFQWLHPPTLTLSLFPKLDPLASWNHAPPFLKPLLWSIVTLMSAPFAKWESFFNRSSVYTAYLQYEI